MFVAASTRCFSDKSLAEACFYLDDLEYDKVELWMNETNGHLKPSEVAASPEKFVARYREMTRLVPVSLMIDDDVSSDAFAALSKVAKLFRITQITVNASPLGTPFNAEIDRLREYLRIASGDGVLVAIKTRTGTLTEDPHTAVELCQSAQGLGISLDPSYYICHPRGPQGHDQTFPHLYHVQLRDSQPQHLQVPIGLGEIEYSKLVTQLRRFRYDRSLCVEMYPELMDVSTRPIELRKMRLLLESLL